MTFKDLIKTLEGAVVLGGLVLTVLFGKAFAIVTGAVYVFINVPALWSKIKEWWKKLTSGNSEEIL